MLQYVKELKNRFIIIICSWVVNFTISYYYKEVLLFFIVKHLNLNFNYFITTNVTDTLVSYLYLSYFNAILLTFIIFSYHLIAFLAPSLFFFEFLFIKQYTCKTIPIVFSIIFLLNTYIVPCIWNFFLSFQNSEISITLYFEGKLNEYIDFYIGFFLNFVIIIQSIFTVFLLISKIKDFATAVKRKRKGVYLFFLLLSTLFTPPDVFSQLFIFFFSQLICEFFILLIFISKYI